MPLFAGKKRITLQRHLPYLSPPRHSRGLDRRRTDSMHIRFKIFPLITTIAFGLQIGIPVAAQTPNWGQKSALLNNPTQRQKAAMAYDPVHRQLVMFGGQNGAVLLAETWVFDGTNWIQKSPATSPSARVGHAMATDSSGHVVLFGGAPTGGAVNETWVWDGANWTQKAPQTSPPAR